mmetsp:Transcript_50173/g.145817  ORF Transcript_50173/g.145817 Transcript_50173/m.145817 type:complete len:353 (+) Transcript_50173:189-1247(+)
MRRIPRPRPSSRGARIAASPRGKGGTCGPPPPGRRCGRSNSDRGCGRKEAQSAAGRSTSNKGMTNFRPRPSPPSDDLRRRSRSPSTASRRQGGRGAPELRLFLPECTRPSARASTAVPPCARRDRAPRQLATSMTIPAPRSASASLPKQGCHRRRRAPQRVSQGSATTRDLTTLLRFQSRPRRDRRGLHRLCGARPEPEIAQGALRLQPPPLAASAQGPWAPRRHQCLGCYCGCCPHHCSRCERSIHMHHHLGGEWLAVKSASSAEGAAPHRDFAEAPAACVPCAEMLVGSSKAHGKVLHSSLCAAASLGPALTQRSSDQDNLRLQGEEHASQLLRTAAPAALRGSNRRMPP